MLWWTELLAKLAAVQTKHMDRGSTKREETSNNFITSRLSRHSYDCSPCAFGQFWDYRYFTVHHAQRVTLSISTTLYSWPYFGMNFASWTVPSSSDDPITFLQTSDGIDFFCSFLSAVKERCWMMDRILPTKRTVYTTTQATSIDTFRVTFQNWRLIGERSHIFLFSKLP